jgi:acyl-CoA reductase-like NAD-dependent aldehyde dehydrogenase
MIKPPFAPVLRTTSTPPPYFSYNHETMLPPPQSTLPPQINPAFIDSLNPATQEINATFDITQISRLPKILESARNAQKEWTTQPLASRAAALRRLQAAIFNNREKIADVISRETGKPRVEAIFAEILLALDTAGFLAKRATKWLKPEKVPHHNLAMKAKSGWLEFDPLGIVAIISPWNYPFSIPMAQVIPAILAGNAIILKPSELTPGSGALIGELGAEAQLPKNLVQVIQGHGDLGAALVESGPDKVFFTGSVATGQRIAEACARKLIPSSLELGGKDPMIVLADADLNVASSAAVWGSFMNCGQTCISVERIYVEAPIVDQFTKLCVEKTKQLRLGPPSDPDAEIGPMIRPSQLAKVEQQISEAKTRGARVLTGGNRRSDLGPNFLEPSVVTQVDHSMDLMRDETFGPVLAIQMVKNADEAVALANDSRFALSASVWTASKQRGRELASRLRAGSVMINDVASYYGIAEAPHGGSGDSGWGRSHSRLGLLEMVQTKYVDEDRLPRVPKSWWFGYTADLATSAAAFVESLFAPNWAQRLQAATKKTGARGVIFRRKRI